jgi:hypothetical protein
MLRLLKWFTLLLGVLAISLAGFCIVVAVEPYHQVTVQRRTSVGQKGQGQWKYAYVTFSLLTESYIAALRAPEIQSEIDASALAGWLFLYQRLASMMPF